MSYPTVVKTKHLSIEMQTLSKYQLLNAGKMLKPSAKIIQTLAIKDIEGLENFSFSTIYVTDIFKNEHSKSFSAAYTCELSDDFDFKVAGAFSVSDDGTKTSVTIPLMINNKKQNWGVGCEIKFSPTEQIGVYIVGNIPVYGVQCVIKYNVITKDIVVAVRVPLSDGNDDDKKGAASCACSLICLNVDFIDNNVSKTVYQYDTIKQYATNTITNTHRPPTTNTLTNETSFFQNIRDGISDTLEVIGVGHAIRWLGAGNSYYSWTPYAVGYSEAYEYEYISDNTL
jgi:hypothetical protein